MRHLLRIGLARSAQNLVLGSFIVVAASAAVVTFLFACGDPGTGGSGLPTSAGTTTPVQSAPINMSTLKVEAIESNAVIIGGLRYIDLQIEIELSDGSSENFNSLKVGQLVVVSPLQSDAPMLRWKISIKAQ